MISLIVFLIASFSAAGLGSLFTNSSLKNWYPTIKKPNWNPPNTIFAPVWTTLYIMIAIAGWMVWEKSSQQGIQIPIILFIIQLVLNALWSVIFFGLRNPGWAFVEICLLWIFIVLTILAFWSINLTAALLLLPYALWVSFAAFLNYTIWRLNKIG